MPNIRNHRIEGTEQKGVVAYSFPISSSACGLNRKMSPRPAKAVGWKRERVVTSISVSNDIKERAEKAIKFGV